MAMSQRMWRREQERRRRERERRARQRRACMIVVLLAIAAVIIIISRGYFRKDQTTPNDTAQPTASEAIIESQMTDAEPYKSKYDISDVNTSYFNNAAFMGNSIADSISMYNLLENADFYTGVTLDVDNVYTTATGYSTTAAVDQLKSKKFTKIFLSFGEREIAADDVRGFIKSYKSLVGKVKSYQPNAHIYVIGIQPSTRITTDGDLYGMNLGKIKEYNKRIKAMAAEKEIYYVDTVSAIGSDGGYLPSGVSADGISLNRDCCIDLLQYITKKSYVPDASSVNTDDEETDEDTTEDEDVGEDIQPTAKPSSGSTDSEPEPTVNVLKDSANKQRGE